MKKNLQKVLILALGLTTTIASAQWSASSLARFDNTDSENRSGEMRSTLTVDMSAVHISADYNWNTNGTMGSGDIYEAYVSTDVMGFGTLTMGRKDLSFGSGALISSNSWGMDRYTNDGIDFAANFSGFDINLGTLGGIDMGNNYINASGEFGGATFNVLMLSQGDNSAHGYDLGYSLMNGDLNLSVSMNSDYDGDEMTTMGASYNVFENMTASVSRTTYGDATQLTDAIGSTMLTDAIDAVSAVLQTGTAQVDSSYTTTNVYGWDNDGNTVLVSSTSVYNDSSYSAASSDYAAGVAGSAAVDATYSNAVAATFTDGFGMANTQMSAGWANGVLGYQAAGTEVTSLGLSYDLGDISLGYTAHSLINEGSADREASVVSIGYTLNDNTSLSLTRIITEMEIETTWISVSIGL